VALDDGIGTMLPVMQSDIHLQRGNTVSGMLLYAKTEEEIQPDNVYQMHGSQISVKTLDLNLPFVEIAAQMDRIVESHFTGVIKAD
jgi:5-methylcytosine-specific restriction enzyme subunit McrC